MIGESLVVRARASMDIPNYEMEVAARIEDTVLKKLVTYVEERRRLRLSEITGLSLQVIDQLDEIIYSDPELIAKAKTRLAERRLRGEK